MYEKYVKAVIATCQGELLSTCPMVYENKLVATLFGEYIPTNPNKLYTLGYFGNPMKKGIDALGILHNLGDSSANSSRAA